VVVAFGYITVVGGFKWSPKKDRRSATAVVVVGDTFVGSFMCSTSGVYSGNGKEWTRDDRSPMLGYADCGHIGELYRWGSSRHIASTE